MFKPILDEVSSALENKIREWFDQKLSCSTKRRLMAFASTVVLVFYCCESPLNPPPLPFWEVMGEAEGQPCETTALVLSLLPSFQLFIPGLDKRYFLGIWRGSMSIEVIGNDIFHFPR